MRITMQALVDREDGRPPTALALGVVERESNSSPSSGLGLIIQETHDLLQQRSGRRFWGHCYSYCTLDQRNA